MLKLSQDRKVMGVKGEKNSIGLPYYTTCPGATETCKSICYANRSFMAMPYAKEMYQDNYDYIKFCLITGGVGFCARQLVEQIKKNNKSGYFRWNISGDVFSKEYATTIALVAILLPEIKFWIYTRSFDRFFFGAIPENLQVIASFDKDNYEKHKEFRFFRVLPSFLGSLEDAKKMVYVKKWVTCPQLTGKLALAGACVKCKLCINPPKGIGIHFPIKGEKNAG